MKSITSDYFNKFHNVSSSVHVCIYDVFQEDVACSTTANCDGQYGGTILFDQSKPNTSIVKIVIMELCNSALLADVGFRDISVFTSIGESTTV